jgi:hypothetical protein
MADLTVEWSVASMASMMAALMVGWRASKTAVLSVDLMDDASVAWTAVALAVALVDLMASKTAA